MNGETEVSYYCPYCETETSIIVSIESQTDYHVVDECCPNCDAQIEGGTVDELVSEAISNYFSAHDDFECEDVRDIELNF